MAPLEHTEGLAKGYSETARVVEAAGDVIVYLPEGVNLATADISRLGNDLLLRCADGAQIVIRGFLDVVPYPDLVTDGGEHMSGDLAARLAGAPISGAGSAALLADLVGGADGGGSIDPSEGLVFTLLQNPGHGTLYLGDMALTEGATFTQFDIDNGLLSYEAHEPEPFTYAWAAGTPTWDSAGHGPVHQDNLKMPVNGETVVVSFEGDAAGYQNSIGWHRLDADGMPTDPRFLWADTSDGSGAVQHGTTLTIEGLEPGEPFGLFIVQNGASAYRWLPDFVDAQAAFRFDAHGNLLAGSRSISADHISFTGDAVLNPGGGLRARSGIDSERLMIGFENPAGQGDRDVHLVTLSIRYEGSPALPGSDSFSFMATEGMDLLANMDPAKAGYTVAEGEATFSITIDPATQAAA